MASVPAPIPETPLVAPALPARWTLPRILRLRPALSLATLDAAVIGALMLLALATRLLALRWGAGLNADEAVPGLMALHVAEGTDRPVFYWGQHYFGALEAYFVGALFKVFGFQPQLLFVPATLASIALVPLTAALARRLVAGRVDERTLKATGWLAALPVAATTPVMSRMLAHAGGGFALAFALQGVALYALLRAVAREAGPRGQLGWATLFGLASGFLCWVWQPALATTAVLLVVLAARRPAALLAALPALLIGLLPPLSYNLSQDWPTLAEILRKAQTPPDQAPPEIARSRWVLVILLGMAFGGGEDTFIAATNWPQALAVALGLTVCVTTALSTRRLNRLVTGTLGLACFANIAAAHGAVRHLHPAALIAFACFGALPVALFGGDATFTKARAGVSALLAALIVIPNLWLLPVQESVYTARPTFGAAAQQVVDGLTARGLTHGYADYWTAYPITYWSGKRIIVSPVAPMVYGGRFERYPDYTDAVHRHPTLRGLFLLLDAQCDTAIYSAHIREVSGRYRVERLGPHTLFWDISVPPAYEQEALDVLRWRVVTNERC